MTRAGSHDGPGITVALVMVLVAWGLLVELFLDLWREWSPAGNDEPVEHAGDQARPSQNGSPPGSSTA